MNVLISSCTHFWNAEAHYAAVLAQCLLEAGHGAWILTQPGTRNARELERRALPVLTDLTVWSGNPLRWPALRGALRTLQRRLGIDVVDVFRSREFALHVWAARAAGVAVVRTRGSARPVRAQAFNRWLYSRGCQAVVTSAEVLRAELMRELAVPPEHVRTIYFPAERPPAASPEQLRVRRREARARLVAELHWPENAIVLAIVGRTHPEKGHDELVEALALLAPQHPQLRLAILDKRYEDEGPHRERIQRHLEARGLAARARWLGFREDLRALLEGADVGVIPSITSEMNCRVATDFFSMGTPVVAFPTGALPEVVEHGVSGLVAPDHAPRSLADQLLRIIVEPGLAAHLSAGAWNAARGRFDRGRFLEQTLAVYEQARSARSAPQGR